MKELAAPAIDVDPATAGPLSPRALRAASTSAGWRTSAPGASRGSSGGATASPSGTAREATIVAEDAPAPAPSAAIRELHQDEDVLDTWFSSALWPLPRSVGRTRPASCERLYPGDVNTTARDIIFFWVARMIFAGLELVRRDPFHDVVIHSTCSPRRAADVKASARHRSLGRDRAARRRRDAVRALKMSSSRTCASRSARSRRVASSRSSSGTSPASSCRTREARDRRPSRARSRSAGFSDGSTPCARRSRIEPEAVRLRRCGQALYQLTFDDFCDWYAEADEAAPATRARRGRRAQRRCTALERLLALLHLGHATRDRGDLVAHSPPAGRLMVSAWPETDGPRPTRQSRWLSSSSRRRDLPAQRRSTRAERGGAERIFEAVVRPTRLKVDGNVEAERERLRTEVKRAESMLANERFVQKAPPERRRGRAREARAVPGRARCARRLAWPRPRTRPPRTRLQSVASRRPQSRPHYQCARSLRPCEARFSPCRNDRAHERDHVHRVPLAPGRRTGSGSTGCSRCLRSSATRSSHIRPSMSSGRTARRRRPARSRRLWRVRACTPAATLTPRHGLAGAHPRRGSRDADFELALDRVRPAAERLEATQFEVLTAAALAEFADARRRRRRRRSGPGRPVRRDQCAALSGSGAHECAARAHARARPDPRGRSPRRSSPSSSLARRSASARPNGNRGSRERRRRAGRRRAGRERALAAAAASAFLGRAWNGGRQPPGAPRAARRRDLGRRPHARRRCATSRRSCPTVGAIVASILPTRTSTASWPARWSARTTCRHRVVEPRALSAEELAERARPFFEHVEAVAGPDGRARMRGHELGEPVLVTGSLYLLADLGHRPSAEPRTMGRRTEKLSVFALATIAVGVFLAIAFRVGYLLGKLLL